MNRTDFFLPQLFRFSLESKVFISTSPYSYSLSSSFLSTESDVHLTLMPEQGADLPLAANLNGHKYVSL